MLGFSAIGENAIGSVPTSLVLIAPASASSGLSQPITFSWQAVAGVSLYQIEIATDSGFATVVHSEDIANTTVDVSGLDANTEHFWHVRAERD